jgi:hypothetical protein
MHWSSWLQIVLTISSSEAYNKLLFLLLQLHAESTETSSNRGSSWNTFSFKGYDEGIYVWVTTNYTPCHTYQTCLAAPCGCCSNPQKSSGKIQAAALVLIWFAARADVGRVAHRRPICILSCTRTFPTVWRMIPIHNFFSKMKKIPLQ